MRQTLEIAMAFYPPSIVTTPLARFFFFSSADTRPAREKHTFSNRNHVAKQ